MSAPPKKRSKVAAPPPASSSSSSSSSSGAAILPKVKRPSRLWEDAKPALSAPVLAAVQSFGFARMTPVQAACIPLFMTNKDVAVQAQTGSGKTLSFLIPIIEILQARAEPLERHHVGAIIISPTRELASQIAHVFSTFAEHVPALSCLLLVGGSDVHADEENFRQHGGHIVVATPGRLEDTLFRVKEFNTRHLEVLVLDEADRLLDMGFEKSINKILARLPKQRRTGLFSATQTSQVEALMRAGLRNPAIISVKVEDKAGQASKQATPSTLRNYYAIVQPKDKFAHLVRYLAAHADRKVIVFVLTCAMVDYFGKVLPELPELAARHASGGIHALHGQMVQKKRSAIYDEFVRSQNGVLVTTDLIARGVDIPDVDCILQYDPPQNPDYYVHRVGRTARAGRVGDALVYLLPSEDTYVQFLRVKNVPAVEAAHDLVPPADAAFATQRDALLQRVRDSAMADRDIMERAQKAFVSFVRAYNEHHCNFIFRLAQLDLGQLATGLALLYLPIMSELKGKHIPFEACDRPPHEIAFKDKQREKQRLENADTRKEAAIADRAKRDLIRAERARAHLERRAATKNKKAKTHEDYAQEWRELQREEALARRVAKGALSREDFEVLTGERIASTAAAAAAAAAVSGHKRKAQGDSDDDSDDDDESSDEKTNRAPQNAPRLVVREAFDAEAMRSKKQARKRKLEKKKEKIAKMKQDAMVAAVSTSVAAE